AHQPVLQHPYLRRTFSDRCALLECAASHLTRRAEHRALANSMGAIGYEARARASRGNVRCAQPTSRYVRLSTNLLGREPTCVQAYGADALQRRSSALLAAHPDE